MLTSTMANAVVVNFAGVPNVGIPTTTYSESGVNAEVNNGALAYYSSNVGTVHLLDFVGAHTSSISFSMTGQFDAIGFDMFGFTRNCSAPCDGSEAFDNVKVSGYRDNLEVASSSFFSGFGSSSYLFEASFTDLDSLTIEMLLPVPYGDSACGMIFHDFCSYINLDNLNLQAVEVTQTPLPAGLPLYGAGLILLGYGIRRRKNSLNAKR